MPFTGAALHCSIDHSVIAEAEVTAVTDDDMVEHVDAEQFTSLHEPLRKQDVLLARSDVTARVVVDKNDGSCRLADGGLEGITGVNNGR
jgi:hypothetical protein